MSIRRPARNTSSSPATTRIRRWTMSIFTIWRSGCAPTPCRRSLQIYGWMSCWRRHFSALARQPRTERLPIVAVGLKATQPSALALDPEAVVVDAQIIDAVVGIPLARWSQQRAKHHYTAADLSEGAAH